MLESRPALRLPARVLPELVQRCDRVGHDALGALRATGRVAGAELADELATEVPPETAGRREYWEVLERTLGEMGFGRVTYEVLTPGVASVTLPELPEADREDGSPGCPFTTGLLAGLLGHAAGETVAVLEVECRVGGHPSCRFLVGPEPRLRTIRERLVGGSDLTEALEGL